MDRPAGIDATAAEGDLVLDNGLVRAVIDAVDHTNHLAVSGGTLIDLAPAGGADALNQVMQAVGILPRDQAEYLSVELGEVTPTSASVIARGRLYQDDRMVIVTRYELRACEPGVRIRTEVYNGGRIPQTFFLTDAYFWGNRGQTPFVPSAGGGFSYPPLDLLTIGDAFRDYPFMSAQTHTGVEETAYAVLGCSDQNLSGFNTTTLSASGRPRQVIMPGDGLAFERILFATRGAGSSAAQALAMQARLPLFGEASATVSGTARFVSGSLPLGKGRDLSLMFTAEDGTPWAEAVPDAQGHYSVRVPRGQTYSVQPYSFGRAVLAPQPVVVAADDVVFDLSDMPLPANLVVSVRDNSETDLEAELVLRPTGATNEESSKGSLYSNFGGCSPYLGPPHGSSPACNRVLVRGGRAVFQLPPGDYWVYATHGPDFTLQRQRVTIGAGETQTLTFHLERLPGIFPADALSADFHVHGGRSFDTQIPDDDRVASFLASGVQVIAATDHDVVGSYEAELLRRGVTDQIFVMPGTELTGLVLFYKRAGGTVPRTLGHFNFWPLTYDPLQARNGTIWDDLKEPGALFDLMTPLIGPDGVRQLNHPYAESNLGRDEGYARAIGYHVDTPIPEVENESPEGNWLRKPLGDRRNIDFDVQEVMNGAELINFMQYRANWYSFLRQGFLRAGTANSDSHTLVIEQVGYPRNIVLTPHSFPAVDVHSFNAAVRDGRMVGTNGPYIDATTTDGHSASLTPFTPPPGAKIHVVLKAAPWIPVEELRVLVNGQVVQRVPTSVMAQQIDPFGTAGVVRYEGDFLISDLLRADGFINFEAGLALPDLPLDEDYGVPLFPEEPLPARAVESDARYHIDTVSPGTWPTAFTNPLVIDVAGDGWKAPGLGAVGAARSAKTQATKGRGQ